MQTLAKNPKNLPKVGYNNSLHNANSCTTVVHKTHHLTSTLPRRLSTQALFTCTVTAHRTHRLTSVLIRRLLTQGTPYMVPLMLVTFLLPSSMTTFEDKVAN